MHYNFLLKHKLNTKDQKISEGNCDIHNSSKTYPDFYTSPIMDQIKKKLSHHIISIKDYLTTIIGMSYESKKNAHL